MLINEIRRVKMATNMTAGDKIVAVVNRSKTPLTKAQVAARTRVNEKTVSNLLPILSRKGLIRWN